MEDEEVLLKLFEMKHGTISGWCYVEVDRNELGEPLGVNLCKDGNVCWTDTATDLLVWFVGQQLQGI